MKINITPYFFLILLLIGFSCSSGRQMFTKQKVHREKHRLFESRTSKETETVLVDKKAEKVSPPVAKVSPVKEEKTATLIAEETQVEKIEIAQPIVQNDALARKNETKTKSLIEENSVISALKSFSNQKSKIQRKIFTDKQKGISDEAILYCLLAIFLPFVAVGLVTDWDLTKVLICVLLCIIFWLPGVIYAFYTLDKGGVI